MAEITAELLRKHELELSMYEGSIDGCYGCGWKYSYTPALDGWESYIQHLEHLESEDERKVQTETEYVIEYWEPEDGWTHEYTISNGYLSATNDTPEDFYEKWIKDQPGNYCLVKRVTESHISDEIIKQKVK